jgi:hypothetical protein
VPTAQPTPNIGETREAALYSEYVIGQSSRGFPLSAHKFNDGANEILLVGGIHGGYEWNTILLAYDLIDYFKYNPAAVPDSVTLNIIPVANPDGLEEVTGKTDRFDVEDLAADTLPGRWNGNEVDLNRNWDCNWQEMGTWRDRPVSGGSEVFSEPETKILKELFLQTQPVAVIFLHSAADGVFASGCPDTHQPSMALASVYGVAAGYPIYERFSAYEVTGDAGDWLSQQEIASISVELIDHNYQERDFRQNLAGMLAVLNQYQ